jgi:hypothetical protein
MAQVVQDLPRKYKALSSKPSTVKTKTNKQKGQKDLDRHFIKDFQMANRNVTGLNTICHQKKYSEPQ